MRTYRELMYFNFIYGLYSGSFAAFAVNIIKSSENKENMLIFKEISDKIK